MQGGSCLSVYSARKPHISALCKITAPHALETEEIARQSRTLATLSGDQGLGPTMCMVAHSGL